MSTDLAFRSMAHADLNTVVQILKSDEKLAFGDWEENLLSAHCNGNYPVLRVILACKNGVIVGLSMYGITDDISAINHFWVTESERGSGLSRILLDKTLHDLKGTHIHLMVVAENKLANSFFGMNGFRKGAGFYESDLDPPDIGTTVSGTQDQMLLGLRGLLDIIPSEDVWESTKAYFTSQGVRRIHYLIAEEPVSAIERARLSSQLIALGFRRMTGETLWVLDQRTPR